MMRDDDYVVVGLYHGFAVRKKDSILTDNYSDNCPGLESLGNPFHLLTVDFTPRQNYVPDSLYIDIR